MVLFQEHGSIVYCVPRRSCGAAPLFPDLYMTRYVTLYLYIYIASDMQIATLAVSALYYTVYHLRPTQIQERLKRPRTAVCFRVSDLGFRV